MMIKQLIARNFKRFRYLDLTFPQGSRPDVQGSFHLLIGRNGAGKSTILDALAISLGIWRQARPKATWHSIRPGQQHLVVEDYEDSKRFRPAGQTSVAAKGSFGGLDLAWHQEIHPRDGKSEFNFSEEALDVVSDMLGRGKANEDYQSAKDVAFPVLAFYGAGRAWLPPSPEHKKVLKLEFEKVSRFDAYRDCLDGRVKDDTINSWFLYETVEAAQRSQKRTGMRAVEAAILSCFRDAENVRFDVDRKEIVIQIGDRHVPFSNLGDGQRAVLSLIADLAIRSALLNPQFGDQCVKQSPGVVLIDELDLHLHPEWQRKIVDSLKTNFPNIQFFCTSHSPFVIQSIEPGELIRLDGPGDELVFPSQQNVSIRSAPTSRAGTLPDYAGESIEDIVEHVQGVTVPQRSEKSKKLGQAAERYFNLLRETGGDKSPVLLEAEAEYREAVQPFSTEPGLSALLKLEAMAAAKK